MRLKKNLKARGSNIILIGLTSGKQSFALRSAFHPMGGEYSLPNEKLSEKQQLKQQLQENEKIKKDFIQSAKNKIIDDISNLSNDAKKMLKYLESRSVEVAVNEICIKCFLMKQAGGGYSQTVNNYGKELVNVTLAEKKQSGRYRGNLKNRINELLQVHEATTDEVDNLYNHIIMEMLTVEVKQ